LDYDGRRLTDLDSNEFIPRKKMDVSKRSLAVRGRLRTAVGFLVVLCAAGAVWMGARAQAQSKANPTATVKKLMPRPAEACCGYNFPRETDAELADGDVHRVHYEDKHIMLLEVSNPPLLHVKMHGHPFTSVFANDSTTGAHNPEAPDVPADQINRTIDPKSDYNDMGGTRAAPPAGMMWPACTPAAPQAPHEGPFNTGLAPNHFYRLEFLKTEGDDFQSHWKEWYPEISAPVKTVADLPASAMQLPKFSAAWPYPLNYDAIYAAPNNFKLLFEDNKIRLVEVTVRPGETTLMAGNPYPAVLAYNGNLDTSKVTETWLDPKSPLNGQGGGHSGPPKNHGLKSPTCGTIAAESPHKIHNGGTTPLHYYRIEYKRIDGDELTAKWREWYPWMQFLHFMR
jgi:hypothetical protein